MVGMGRCLKQTKQHTHNGGRRVWGGVGGLGWWWLEEGAVHGAGWGNGAGVFTIQFAHKDSLLAHLHIGVLYH